MGEKAILRKVVTPVFISLPTLLRYNVDWTQQGENGQETLILKSTLHGLGRALSSRGKKELPTYHPQWSLMCSGCSITSE